MKLWQHWANVAKFWICEPNSSCFVQNNLQRIHLWTNQFCLYYDLMFTSLINYQNVLKLVNIFSSLRVLTRNLEIVALPWSCGIKSRVWPKSSHFFTQLFPFKKDNEAFFFVSKEANTDRPRFYRVPQSYSRHQSSAKETSCKIAIHDCKSIKRALVNLLNILRFVCHSSLILRRS